MIHVCKCYLKLWSLSSPGAVPLLHLQPPLTDFREALLTESLGVEVGDRKGKVGIGSGKANEVPDAIKKAVQSATKNIVRVSIVDDTIPHEAIGRRGASKVMLKPASKGTGVKAGGPVRSVLELAGVKNILSKSLGSNTKVNMAYATLEALKSQRTIEKVAALRGKKVEEIR